MRNIARVWWVGLGLRLALAPFTADPWDLAIWADVGRAVLDGVSPYALRWDGLVYPYLPPWALWSAAAVGLQAALAPEAEWLLRVLLKLPLIAADLTVAGLLCRLAVPSRRAAVRAAYLLNPLAIVLCGAWGMIDALPVALLLAAVLGLSVGRPGAATLALGAACAFKLVFPGFLVPWFALVAWRAHGGRAALGLLVGAALIPVVTAAPYLLRDPLALWEVMVAFHWGRPPQVLNLWTWLVWAVEPAWGAGVVRTAGLALPVAWLAALAGLAARSRGRRETAQLLPGLIVLVGTFYAASKVVNEQYVLWQTALLLALWGQAGGPGRAGAWLLSTIATAAIAVHIGLGLLAPVWPGAPRTPEPQVYWILGWLGLVFWLAGLTVTALVARGAFGNEPPGATPVDPSPDSRPGAHPAAHPTT